MMAHFDQIDAQPEPAASRTVPEWHALRVSLSEIMHDRTLPLGKSPVRVRQWLIMHDEGDDAQFSRWLSDNGGNELEPNSTRLTGNADNSVVIWERHNEFSTITAIRHGSDSKDEIAESPWLSNLPGRIFRSIEILLGSKSDFAWDTEAQFEKGRLVSSYVFDGAARIWSDFIIKKNGSGRILIEDLGLQNDEVARLVQSLIEIGNYRKLALLGFPIARELMPWITELEAEHTGVTERHNSGKAGSSEILEQLSALSAVVEYKAGLARFRLGATSSYHLLTTDRLRSLREVRIPGFSTVAEFVERRLLPAMRTCEIAQSRLESLSERINRTASLLSLEQTTELNRRNQAILASLNKRSALQLRLQNLVEGFSVFAISYYIIAILEKITVPLSQLFGLENGDVVTALLVCPIILVTWRLLKQSKESATIDKLH